MRSAVLSVLVLLLAISIATAADELPSCRLNVGFDLNSSSLRATAEISLPASSTGWTIHTEGLKVVSVRSSRGNGSFSMGTDIIKVLPATDGNDLAIEYSASYPSPAKRNKEDGIETANIISSEGISLISSWYPYPDGPMKISLSAVLPSGFEGISEADVIEVKPLPDGRREFTFLQDTPVGSVNLIAAKYSVLKDKTGTVDVLTYFFPEDAELASKYLDQTKKYIAMYEAMIGPFPFRRFSVVENILPTGYSMPTYTLLGRDVVRLPFISETSLGHEVLHQWFGNSVYADRTSGNWAEGMTTYLADHLYEEQKGRGRDYRKYAIVSYMSYMTEQNEFALKDFVSRTDKATASVGYGKTAMVFHMLRQEVGDDIFLKALRSFYSSNRFRPASWADIRTAFEAASGKKLDRFFEEWINGKGMIDFDIENTMLVYEGSKAKISFDIVQKKKYAFRLPVIVRTDKGDIKRTFDIDKERNSVWIDMLARPQEIVIDGDYDLFRTLYDEEMAPVIAMLLGDSSRIFVVPEGKEKEYAEVVSMLREEGFTEKKESELKYEEIKDSSLLIMSDTGLARRLFTGIDIPDGDLSLVMKHNPYGKRVIGILKASAAEEAKGYLRRITHYGKYSAIAFAGGRNILKTEGRGGQGIRLELKSDPLGVEVPKATRLSDVIEKVRAKDILYVGEHHDRPEHHRVQFEIIRELYSRNKKIAIGMEMFQKPYQEALDDYVTHKIDEKTFLKKTEYFKRWVFDYNLYREILLFARENRIPVIALNIKKEIVDKVAKEGLQSLKEDEIKHLPAGLDLSDSVYRERLRTFFARHAGSANKNFDFFFQSQVLWDESMAHNLDDFIKKNPDYQMVVMAGGGHMMFGSGIPRRAHRMNKRSYAVILNGDDVEKDVADFVLYPQSVVFPESPKLGVMLKEEGGELLVTGFSPGSVAENAGLKTEDVVLSVDNEKISSVEDLKLILFYKKKGDELTVKVRRKRFLFGDREIEIRAAL